MPDGKAFPGKMKETDQKIVEIIGMDINQFSQVSMISQGDFMKLLLASSRERKEVFSRIFPTKIYWQIQNNLSEQEKKLYGQLEDVRKVCQHEIENVQCLPESPYTEKWKEKGSFSDIDNRVLMKLLEEMNEEAEQRKGASDISERSRPAFGGGTGNSGKRKAQQPCIRRNESVRR